MKKKLLAFILAASLIVGSVPISSFAATLPFEDVPTTAWYYGAVERAYEEGLFKGVSETEFDPEGTMTRGMFVTVLANMTSDYDETAYAGDPVFDDVAANDWFAAPVNWAIEHELTEGIGDNLFDPEGKVTREQMAMFMYKYAIASGNDLAFTEGASATFVDATSVSSWAKTAVDWAVTHKVINGDDNNRLNPGDDAQRCEVAQVAINAKGVLTNTSLEETPTPSPTPEVPSGGGGGGGPVTPPDPTPTPTPTPAPLDDVVAPEDVEITEIPDGAIQYNDFASLFEEEYRIVPDDDSTWRPTLKVNLSEDLSSKQVESIQSLGEDLEKTYYSNLANKYVTMFQSSLGIDASLRDYRYIKIVFMGPTDVYALTSIAFSVPYISSESYDGIPDELYVDEEDETSWQNWSNVYFAVSITRETIPEIVQNGGATYEEFKKLFCNRSEIQRNQNDKIVGINLYPSEPLTEEQYISLGKLGSSVLRLYCEEQVEELVSQNVFGLTRDELYSFSIYYYPSKEDAEKGYSRLRAFYLDYVPHPEDHLDYQPGWTGGNTTLWWESEIGHWFNIYDPENKKERYSPEYVEFPLVPEGGISYEEFKSCLADPVIDESSRADLHSVDLELQWKSGSLDDERNKLNATGEDILKIYFINSVVDVLVEHPDWQNKLASVYCHLSHSPMHFSLNYSYESKTEDQIANIR